MIPENIQEFALKLATLAREYKLSSLTGDMRPGIDDKYHNTVSFSWHAGRHGADVDEINLVSTERVLLKLKDSKKRLR